MKRVVVISDTQMPFEDKRALKNVIDFVGEYQPDEVIQIGDLVDYPTPSRWSAGTGSSSKPGSSGTASTPRPTSLSLCEPSTAAPWACWKGTTTRGRGSTWNSGHRPSPRKTLSTASRTCWTLWPTT
ncbi:metallophosphoesterase family protein [Streptomyces sp. INA 01156]